MFAVGRLLLNLTDTVTTGHEFVVFTAYSVHSADYAVTRCPSVCHTPVTDVFYQNG